MSNISRFIGNERGDKICHEDDGCPTELAVLKRFWREQQASTLPEEVANLVELLDEEEAPYEDSSGVALSLTGRAKQYANGKTADLHEQVEKLTDECVVLRASSRSKLETIANLEWQVEKLTKERDALVNAIDNEMVVTHMGVFNPVDDPKVALNKICCYAQDLGKFFAEDACKEQLAALAEQNEKMRETLIAISIAWSSNEIYSQHFFNEALSLPDLATPALNSIPKEPTLPVFDADSPRFRQVFDEAVQAHNLPSTRKGEGYRSPITQWCFEIAYSVVNRLRLYEK